MMPKKESKSKNEKLSEKLFLSKKSVWEKLNKKETKQVFDFCEDYKDFMNKSKNERLCVKNIISVLKKKGFKNMSGVKSAKPGDKLYKEIKGKTVVAFIVGKEKEAFNLVGSHVDSPRLDLKPNPLFEDSNLALMQTHYYGGIKKYHWVNTPLMLCGVVVLMNGTVVDICIGDKANEPKFIISDLLPHLAKDQMEKPANKFIEGEDLNLIVGHLPVVDEKIKEKVKFTVLEFLYSKYGIVEEDFVSAELEALPAGEAFDIGFDRALIGAYGHDDKVCVYTSLQALVDVKKPKTTAIGFFVDKEEIGSVGNTGAASFILPNFLNDYVRLLGLKTDVSKIFERSMSISADVTAGMNPTYKSVNDPQNVSYLGNGVAVEKYTGGGGKGYTNDTHPEFVSYIRRIADKADVNLQVGELGKVDIGGGGTIAMYMSKYGMDCIDIGPALLGMHSPWEVASKADIYSAYKLYLEFFSN